MIENGSTITIRPNAEDQKIISSLTQKMGLTVTSLIRLALRRLNEEESQRTTKHDAAVRTSRKR